MRYRGGKLAAGVKTRAAIAIGALVDSDLFKPKQVRVNPKPIAPPQKRDMVKHTLYGRAEWWFNALTLRLSIMYMPFGSTRPKQGHRRTKGRRRMISGGAHDRVGTGKISGR